MKDHYRSMSQWVGLAPTMLTHAILMPLKEKFCPCLARKKGWTSIRDGDVALYPPVLMSLACAMLMVSLIAFRVTECVSAPNAPVEACPVLGKELPNTTCDCSWTWYAPDNDVFQLGGRCKVTPDDNSVCRCACCCDYVGVCGYIHVHERGSLRPSSVPPPCNPMLTSMAVIYGGMLAILIAPWFYAVIRDIRKLQRSRTTGIADTECLSWEQVQAQADVLRVSAISDEAGAV